MTFTPAEYVGMLALVLNFIAYRQPTANRYRIISALALGSLSIHFALIDATAGAVVTGLAFFRNFIALRWQGPFVLWFFIAANVVLWIFEAVSGAPQLPLVFAYVSSLIFSIGSIRLNDPVLIRRWFILAELLGLGYAFMVGSLEGMVFNLVNLSSIILKMLQDRRV